MSRGLQHRPWSARPENRALMAKVEAAHFHHSYGLGGESGLTYQSCRFCGSGGFESEDHGHGDCYVRKSRGRQYVCRGLWKYEVRHYICSDCRRDILLGLQPAKSRTKTPPVDLR